MAKQTCLVIGNVRDGECEGLFHPDIEVLLIRNTKETAKITTAKHVKVVAEYDFNLGYSEILHELVKDLLSRYMVTSVLNYRESYVSVTEAICSNHPLLAHLHKNIGRTLDKAVQRSLYGLAENPDLKVHSAKISVEDLLAGRAGLNFPYILKPASLYSSLFVKCIRSEDDLLVYLNNEWPEFNRYVKGKVRETNQLLIEEYLLGSNHSIDCAIDRQGNVTCFPIVDVITGMEIDRNDFHHFARYAPTVIAAEMADRCRHLAIDAVKALDLRSTFSHVEFILTDNGPRILEIAARPGGSRIHVLREAYGINLDLAYHQILSGLPLTISNQELTTFGIVTPFAKKKQIYSGLHSEERISKIPAFRKWYSFVRGGDMIGPVGDGFQNYLYIEIESSQPSELRKSIFEISTLDVFDGE